MTLEQRRQALDFGKIRGTGMPVPIGNLVVAARAHILNIYYQVPSHTVFFNWRNRNRVSALWSKKSIPATSWKGKSTPAGSWAPKVVPPDGNVQEI